MMGYEEDKNFFKNLIRDVLEDLAIDIAELKFPNWYPELIEGIFCEVYGLSGLASWAFNYLEKYKDSSSAKIIGDRLFCLIDGKSELQPQRISENRREKLKRTLLLAAPKERLEYGFHEIYMLNGIRITIYSGDRTKPGQDIMVFRKYLIERGTFETLAEKGTIPGEAADIFKAMVHSGYNVLFSGQVRSGKTTFLRTWQSYEDETLEGLAVATDPETPWHNLMPKAPIMQLVADGGELEQLTKSILRGDNDYIIMEEMRDGTAYNVALEMLATGTRRSKMTIHDRNPRNIPYKMASKIKEKYGGDMKNLLRQIYSSYDFCLHFQQDERDRSKKYLMGIYRFRWNEKEEGQMQEVCTFNIDKKNWSWNADGLLDEDEPIKTLISKMQRS